MHLKTLCALAVFTLPLLAQHKPAPKPQTKPAIKEQDQSPVGRWVARHGVNDEVQLWWQFRLNGTVTMTEGPIARTTWKLEGSALTLGVGSKDTPAGVFDTLFDGGKLYTRPHVSKSAGLVPVLQFTRIGTAPDPKQAILGQWRMTDSPPSSDPAQEAIRERLLHMVVSYKADGAYEVRIATRQLEGTWDATAKTYTLQGFPALPFQRQGPGLNITNPTNPDDKHTYFIDQMF